MGRVLAIDYGAKRTGLAWTDPLRMIASPLEACHTTELFPRLETLIAQGVEEVVLGYPTRLDGRPTDSTTAVEAFAQKLCERWPAIPLHLVDERFSSRLAAQALHQAGATRQQKQNKMLENSVSAAILLQNFLG
ncbi:MAG: Holliday junction resolvase RuvX [Bacteroidetes bacterium]|nr:Holliday junction resolvase RuvX [Bacteroidota bacterium]